ELGGKIIAFTPDPSGSKTSTQIEYRAPVPARELVERLRREVDVLYLPMSFDLSERNAVEMSFPSKLTDYTATGLPLLIQGPEYCSAVRWAQEVCDVAEIATMRGSNALRASLKRLSESPKRRHSLGMRALVVGS